MIPFILTILLGTLAAVFTAGQYRDAVDDSAAASTGRYLLQVRGAVVDLQVKYQSWLSGANLPEASEDSSARPGLTWDSVDGVQVARGGVAQLVDLGLLPSNTPRYPLLGDTVRFVLVRQGSCPGADCRTTAFVYTCHPVSDARSRRQPDGCAAPAGDRATFSASLLAKVLISADGYGGHDATGGPNVIGPLMNAPRQWFDFSPEPGHAVLAAGLDATPFGQFVRHGETRPVTLHNTLTVGETIQSNKGLLLNTAVASGEACSPEGLYAATADKMLAVCLNGAWFAANSHVVTGVYANLPNNATIPSLTCPAGLSAWRYVAMQDPDVTVTGSDINVAGDVGGTIRGSGSVNAAGSVSVNGSFTGTFQNAGTSYVRVAQSVAVVADRIAITPAGPNARAAVIQGCKS
ncbi:hypothetical protein [Bordetella petrii]|uniref:hypothetical protein n=1 Tax=Bordetella petrii TaxID=94624 RepID=UPI00048C5F2C|nr:hypothetical protein [Bordetella petrii]